VKLDATNYFLKPFRKIVKKCLNNEFYRLVFKGGRSSGKSTVAAALVVLRTVKTRHSAMCIVKYTNKSKQALGTPIKNAILDLKLDKQFKWNKNLTEFVLLDKKGKETDIVIFCSGADRPETLRSFKESSGGFSTLWVEETQNFDSELDIQDIESTFSRSLDYCTVIYSYNPLQGKKSFLNKLYDFTQENDRLIEKVKEYDDYEFEYRLEETNLGDEDNPDLKLQCICHCTYKILKRFGLWKKIAPTDRKRILQGEKDNSNFYRWWYLGDTNGTGEANVFNNLDTYKFDKSLLNNNDIYNGLDWSYGGKDPHHFGRWYYDSKNNDLYCVGEIRLPPSAGLVDLYNAIRIGGCSEEIIYCDSGNPLLIKELKNMGLYSRAADKFGKTNGKYAGIFWLRSLHRIYIDPDFTPFTFQEFAGYEYAKDKKTGEILSEIPDGDDHSVDTCRYAICKVIKSDSLV